MTKWTETDNRAIAVIRVSSHAQKDNISHETQEAEIRAYCIEAGLELLKPVPITESARRSHNRVKYARLIQSAFKQGITHIVFYMYDRETRNLTDNEKNEDLVKEGKLVLHYARERKVLHKDSPDSDFFMRDISAATNKHFIRTLSAKMGDAMRMKAEGGWYPGNWPPLGYKHQKIKDENGKELRRGSIIVADPNNLAVGQVTREFELRSQGFSFQAIRDAIIAEGFLQSKDIPKYHKSEVEKRLKNPFYAGRFRWKGIEYPGKHPLIIPREIVLKVQGGVTYRKTTRKLTEFNLFGYGWMKCMDCGCQYVYESKKNGRFHFYRCSNMRDAHLSLRGLYMPLSNVWQALEASIDRITIPASFAKEIAKALNENHSKSRDGIKVKISTLKQMILNTERQEYDAYSEYKSGIIDELGYQLLVRRFRSDADRYRSELLSIETAANADFAENANTILELSEYAKALWNSRNVFERKEFSERLYSNRFVSGVTPRFELKNTLEIVAKMKEKESWRLHLDDLRTALLLSPINKSLKTSSQEVIR